MKAISILFTLSLILIFSCKTTKSGDKPTHDKTMTHLDDEWKEVDSLLNHGLKTSAVDKIKEIGESAFQGNDQVNWVKAILRYNQVNAQLEEDTEIRSIQRLNQALLKAGQPAQSILHTALAESYRNYLNNHLWELRDRAEVVAKPDSIAEWNVRHFIETINFHFENSLEWEGLISVPVKEYKNVLSDGRNTDTLRPTLYDVLAHHAIDYYLTGQSHLVVPSETFVLNDPKAFANNQDFVNTFFNTPDSLSVPWKTITYFQKLLKTRLADNNHPDALIDSDLKRLLYVFNSFEGPDKEKLYESALMDLQKKYDSHAETATILFYRASALFSLASQWSPGGDDAYRLKYKEAFELSKECVQKYPGTYGAAQCENLIISIQQRDYSVQIENIVPSGQYQLMSIKARNVDKLYFRIIKISEDELRSSRYQRQDELINKLRAQKPLVSFDYAWKQPDDFQHHITESSLPSLDLGSYALLTSDNSDFGDASGIVSFSLFGVSDLAYWVVQAPTNRTEIVVSNRKTGAPIADAKVDFIPYRYTNRNELETKVIASETTDSNGKAVFPSVEDGLRIKVSKGNDSVLDENAYYSGRYQYDQSRQTTYMFLDRSIYRPGQRVYFKSYAVNFTNDGIPQIMPNHSVSFTLKDANYQSVGTQKLKTNAFGTCSGYFDLPSSGLTGTFTIESSIDGRSTHFNVEEYKRPKFEIKWDTIEQIVRLNESITVNGNAIMYAGPAVPNAKVVWRVQRSTIVPWYYRYWKIFPPDNSNVQIIAQGVTNSNENGQFSIPFNSLAGQETKQNVTYVFEVSATVTDGNGESHDSNYQIHINKQGFTIDIQLQDLIPVEDLKKVNVSAQTTQGKDANLTGKVKVSKLSPPGTFKRNRLWQVPDVISMSENDYQTNLPFYFHPELEEKVKWPEIITFDERSFSASGNSSIDLASVINSAGVYKLSWTWTDGKGEPLTFDQVVEVYEHGKKLAGQVIYFVDTNDKSYQPGESVNVALLTGLNHIPYVFEITEKQKSISSSWQSGDGVNRKLFSIEEADRGGLFVTWISVFNNRFLTQSKRISVSWTNKEADVALTTYRNITEPGSKEKWTIDVTPKSKSSDSKFEYLLSMYDRSLDQFVPHAWNFSVFQDRYSTISLIVNHPSPSYSHRIGYGQPTEHAELIDREYRRLLYIENYGYYLSRRYKNVAAGSVRREGEADELSMAESAPAPTANDADVVAQVEEQKSSNDPIGALRTALDETVFFFPHEESDQDGKLTFNFTMKEGLTSWKFQALAHNRELVSGYTTTTIQTQKELMVFPNPPRFFRERDVIQFPVKVSSMSEVEQKAMVSLKILNALTNEDVSALWGINGEQQTTLKPAGSESVSWMLRIPDGWIEPVKYQVLAKAANHSDGEEGWLPVVTNRILITESLPLPLKAKEERTFVFASMQKEGSTRKPHALTVEMTTSPAWYAVLALPYLMEYPYECAEQTFNRYYANALSRQIVTNQPEIRNVFEQWRRTNSDALLSPLMKNQELKSALLEETPWVQEALSENQQRLNIGNLFEPNLVDQNLNSALRKLREMQNPSGGFSWFKGGNPNVYITTNILEGFGHLRKLKVQGDQSGIDEITKPAVAFIDQEILTWYRDLEKLVKDGKAKWEDKHVGPGEIYYMYTRSFYPEIQMRKEIAEVKAYILKQASQYWLDHSLYVQGLIALTLYRENASDPKPLEIVKSLKESSILHPELGRYWKTSPAYYWYDSGIERQSLFIELFQEVKQPQDVVDELRVWLLKQKQTQRWSSTKSTSSAVYALLIHPDAWLKSVGQVEVKLGNTDAFKNVEPSAGLGYVKESWEANEIKKDWDKINVKNPNAHIAWGSAYYQYWEDIDKVERESSEQPLHIERSLFKVVKGKRGDEVIPVTADNLKVGEKITVRLTIRADRNMEFVHLKDVRGSGFEPTETLSQYEWKSGLGYYQSTRDLGTHFFIDYLPRGTYVVSYDVFVSQAGQYVSGLATLQCMYAPEFTSHSSGSSVSINTQ